MTAAIQTFIFENPNFKQLSKGKFTFCGNVEVNECIYKIKFSAPKFPLSSGILCKVSKGLSDIPLNEFKPPIDARYLGEYLKCLYDFLSSQNQDSAPIISVKTVGDFVDQLKSFSKDKRFRTIINKRYSIIKLANFVGYDDHYLEVGVLKNFEVATRSHSLPEKDSTGSDLFSVSGHLDVIVAQFLRLLEQFSEFYNHLHTIDELCNVVEPVQVTPKHNWRIFRITEKVLGKIVLDPFATSAIVMNFIGPTLEVEKYRKTYNENVHRWDIDLDVYRNLLRIFDLMYFPIQSAGDDNDEKYCNICYMYMYDDHIPIISCDNPLCDLIFHMACLKEWFATLKDGKTFLAVSFGSCPSCKAKLSSSFVQLLEM